jgi:hypothetical protein
MLQYFCQQFDNVCVRQQIYLTESLNIILHYGCSNTKILNLCRSKITSFVGSIKSAEGVTSLAAAATSARLRIRLEAPLDLSPLLGKYDALC